MSDRWVDELMSDEPQWVRDLVDDELRKREARLAEAERLLRELRDFEDDLAVRKIDAFLGATDSADQVSD